MEGTQSQTNYSTNYQEKTDSSMIRPTSINSSPLLLEQVNGCSSNNQLRESKIRHRPTSPNAHELLTAKSSNSKPKTISFSSSIENMSLDEKEMTLQNDQPTTPSPSIFTTNDDHSPVFKTQSANSTCKNVENKNLETSGKSDDLKARSPIKSDRTSQQQIDLRFNLKRKDKNNNSEKMRKPSSSTVSSGQHGSSSNDNSPFISNLEQQPHNLKLDGSVSGNKLTPSSNNKEQAVKLRSSVDRRLAQKRQSRVIKMLAVLVGEFFICWLPLHCINLISLYKPKLVYETIGYNGLTMFLMLAYTSSCTNPITYCFMNHKFRQSFLTLFSCCSGRNNEARTNPQQILKPKIRSTAIEQL